MKFVFRLRLTRVFVARAVHREPLCFISQCVRKHYLMIFNLILCSIPALNSNGRTRVGICNASAILQVSGKLNLLMNLNRVTMIVLGFFNFHFPSDFTGGQCFVETLQSHSSTFKVSACCCSLVLILVVSEKI